MKHLLLPIILVLGLPPVAEALPARPGSSAPVMIPALPVDTRCVLSAGNPVVDYGQQSRWQLQKASGSGNRLTPGKRTLMVNVACPYSQAMQLTVRGDRAANGELRYGDNGTTLLRLHDAQVDGQQVQLAGSTADGRVNTAARDAVKLKPGDRVTAVSNGKPVQGKTFSARLEIEPQLTEDDARVSSRQTSEANLTLELVR